MKQFSGHKYCWSKPFTAIRHEWSLLGPTMAVSFHVTVMDGHEDTAGLELHYFNPPHYMRDSAPSHIDCRYTGGRCWHDGTSLYAMETLWPMVKPMLQNGDHETVFRFLENELARREESDIRDAEATHA